MRTIIRVGLCLLALILASYLLISRKWSGSPSTQSSSKTLSKEEFLETLKSAQSNNSKKTLSKEELRDALNAAQSNNSNVKPWMHRIGAGELDESGWCKASSTEGGFSVCLPNKFNDFTITGMAEDGVELKTYAVATQDKRRIKFRAIAMRRADGKLKGDPLERAR